MNENIDLTKILKDCPKHWKFYSPLCGEVEFIEICDNNDGYCIRMKDGLVSLRDLLFTNEGFYFSNEGAECLLFPSKDQRDWNKFSAPWYKNNKFKDGDIVAVGNSELLQAFILQTAKNDKRGYCYTGYDFKLNKIFPAGKYEIGRFATEEEKQKLFNAIKENGYKWDAKTKTLYKDTKTKTLYKVEPKFKVGDKIVNVPMKSMSGPWTQATISEISNDKYIFTDGSYMRISDQDHWELDKFNPKTLQPFDRVLVRDYNNMKWSCDILSHIEQEDPFPYVGIGSEWKCCIPYNDKTKHLVGTDEEAPEYYKYWED